MRYWGLYSTWERSNPSRRQDFVVINFALGSEPSVSMIVFLKGCYCILLVSVKGVASAHLGVALPVTQWIQFEMMSVTNLQYRFEINEALYTSVLFDAKLFILITA